MGKYKYLGKRVRDIGKKGLDRPSEFRAIMKAIVRDYRKRRISKQTAKGRLLLLYRLTFKKNNKKLKNVSVKTLSRLRREIREAMSRL
ncbi:hypothetical protein [Pyrococcus kukulkanii]|uniref:hypothetical protein n=1 Tax=Pyrococcus kukulkanii TaxID=1609559 RepID=UPI0035689371